MPSTHPIKVALICYRDDLLGGGALRVAQLLAQHLPAEGIEVHLVFAYGTPGPVAQQVTIPVEYLQAKSSRELASYRQARRWFRQQQFDVLHFIDAVHWLYFATLGLGAKRIVHYHGLPNQKTMAVQDQLLGIGKRWLNDAGIVITHGAKRGVARLGWMSAARLHVVPNGVSQEYFQQMPAREHARRELGLPADAYVFGEVARFSEGSGLVEVVDVLKQLPERWHALLAGDGPLRPQIEAYALAQGVSHRLHLTGFLPDVRLAYAAMDAVILLARYQSFCLMLAEAMLAKVPIVGLQGAGEYMEKEYPLITAENAIFFPRAQPWDEQSVESESLYRKLAAALVGVVEDRQATERRVALAADWVASRFSAEEQARRCGEVYRTVLRNSH